MNTIHENRRSERLKQKQMNKQSLLVVPNQHVSDERVEQFICNQPLPLDQHPASSQEPREADSVPLENESFDLGDERELLAEMFINGMDNIPIVIDLTNDSSFIDLTEEISETSVIDLTE